MVTQILFCVLLTVFLFTVFSAEAQQAKKIPRIGFLTLGSVSLPSPLQEAFRDGLHQLGYIEGQNIQIEYRYAEGKVEEIDKLAVVLVAVKPDLIGAVIMQSI